MINDAYLRAGSSKIAHIIVLEGTALDVRGYVFDSISQLRGFVGPCFTTSTELYTSNIKEINGQQEEDVMLTNKWLLA
jgi:hypothetical protein